MRNVTSVLFTLLFIAACGGADKPSAAAAPAAETKDPEQAEAEAADDTQDKQSACARDNGGCGDAEFFKCKDQDDGTAACSAIDMCIKDNGGCGHPKASHCKNAPGTKPICEDIDACATDNGGCGDPKAFTCIRHDRAAPSCGKRVQQVVLGRLRTCALVGSGELYCWGELSSGSDADAHPTTRPARVGSDSDWTTVAIGGHHTCAIRKGELYCWGDGAFGTLGLGDDDVVPRDTPTRVGSDNDWEAVATGATHSCGIRKGALYCWGDNSTAQLASKETVFGPENEGFRAEPMRVGGATDFVQVSCGDGSTCALRGKKLYCWGANDQGQLGLGTLDDSGLGDAEPTQVGSDDDWAQVHLGLAMACGIRAGGELYCWGDNSEGQLGLGSDMKWMTAPTRTSKAADWANVSVSESASCGVHAGQLACWGTVMPDGASVTEPTRIGSDSDWASVASSNTSACGIRAGKLYCWGNNSVGQLGDGTTVSRSEPAAVSFE